MNTKLKIITAAKKLFNKNGYQSVSLFSLAKELKMSRGNITYHFKRKENLLESISNEMWERLEKERSITRSYPSFENLHKEALYTYKLQKEYSFIFLDTHVLRHPLLQKKFRQMTNKAIVDNKATIAYSINMGNMRPESIPGIYDHIAKVVWMIGFFWMTQKIIRGDRKKEDAQKVIWSLLIPHFTDKGVVRFKSYFGEDYFNTLGNTFNLEENLYSTF